MKVIIVNDAGQTHELPISPTALDQVRGKFNPSGLGAVDYAKALGAALITAMEPTRDARGEGGRCAAIAITNVETATMYAVKALTAGA